MNNFIQEYHNHIVEFFYSFFPIMAIITLYFAAKWSKSVNMSEQLHVFIEAFVFIIAAIGIRVGWFSVSRATAPEGHEQNLWMWENKWIMAGVTACMFLYGVMRFINIAEQMSKRQMFMMVFSVSLIAGFIATAW